VSFNLPEIVPLVGIIGARVVAAEFNRSKQTDTIDFDNGYRLTLHRDPRRVGSYLPIEVTK
jgi:hypothetical protein